MSHDSFVLIIALLALLLVILTLGLAIYYRRQSAQLSQKLAVALAKLAAAHDELHNMADRYQEISKFRMNLNEAELTTRLQRPRLSAQQGSDQANAPERYLYVRSLAESGMSGEEIAAVLSISAQEAEQLVNLSKLAAPLS